MNAAHIGCEVTSPTGVFALEKERTYRLVARSAKSGRVLLVRFFHGSVIDTTSRTYQDWQGKPVMARLLVMEGHEFEEGIGVGRIEIGASSDNTPPWLDIRNGSHGYLAEAALDERLSAARDLASKRLEVIQPVLNQWSEIVDAQNPSSALTARIRKFCNGVNSHRARLWCLSFMAYGQNLLALCPRYTNGCCAGSRVERGGRRVGRPSLANGSAGWNLDDAMKQEILRTYEAKKGLRKTMTGIYRSHLRKLGCKAKLLPAGKFDWFHPMGRRFPTFHQFSYCVKSHIGLEAIQKTKLGSRRHRNELAVQEGSFSEHLACALEVAAVDAATIAERPKAIASNSAGEALYVVKLKDLVSAEIIGVGFSSGSERGQAYLDALFCAAINKQEFGRILGIGISASDWSSEGIPSQVKFDRGPASPVLRGHAIARKCVTQQIPSHSGRSNANVETGHHKEIKTQEGPSHRVSNLTPCEMIRREVFRVIAQNHQPSVAERVPPDLVHRLSVFSPAELHRVLAQLGRTSGLRTSFKNAVRTFLNADFANLEDRGLRFCGHIYTSEQLKSSRTMGMIARGKKTKVKVYSLFGCVRHIWAEIDRDLIEVDLTFMIATKKDSLYLTLSQLRELNESKRRIRSEKSALSSAAHQYFEDKFKQHSGKSGEVSQERKGKVTRRKLTRRLGATERRAAGGTQ